MKIKNSMFQLLLAFLGFILFNNIVQSQTIDGYGIKSGISSAWQTETIGNDNIEGIKNVVGFNFGVYAKWFDTKFFYLNTEINFTQKGKKTDILISNSEQPNGTGEYIKEKLQLNYFSILLLPSIYKEIGNIKLYAISGPRMDIFLSKNVEVTGPEPLSSINKNYTNEMIEKYSKVGLGVTLGIGFQINKVLPVQLGLEARYNPDLTKTYDNGFYSIKNNSLEFLVTLQK